jgi:hypothetical protein
MKPLSILALSLITAVFVAPGFAASHQSSFALKASLNAKQQVPPQAHKATDASGRFSGTLNGSGKLVWHLSLAKLSSPVTVAEVFIPANAGKGGQIDLQLCAKCAATSAGVTEALPADVAKAISTRPSYVLIRTKKNPTGEIRGLMTVAKS